MRKSRSDMEEVAEMRRSLFFVIDSGGFWSFFVSELSDDYHM